MNAAELMKRIEDNGADKDGITDRFMGNAELYEICFMDFIEEQNFVLLEQAMAKKDYDQAFESAHALKGLSGNLGVTAFYKATCVLVESLRASRYATVDAEYAEMLGQFRKLKALVSDESEPPAPPADAAIASDDADSPDEEAPSDGTPPPDEEAPSDGTPPPDAQTPPNVIPSEADKPASPLDSIEAKPYRLPLFSIAVLIFSLIGVGLIFHSLFVNYIGNVSKESAHHLVEISHQLKLYVEEKIRNDWRVAYSVGDSIADNKYSNDDAAIYDLMRRKRDVWNVTDLMLYTESGYCVNCDGNAIANDVASNNIILARQLGKYSSIVDSQIIYTVPVYTDLKLSGSNIVAVSVVQSMESFLDEMSFSSFGGKAWMYLTDENGVVISRLTNDASKPVFNFMALTRNQTIVSPDGKVSAADLLSTPIPAAFIMSDEYSRDYVVSAPIETNGAGLRLFYLAPVNVVNEAMNSFSQQLALISLFVILAFTVAALWAFVTISRNRKKHFDEVMRARDRMFELLVKNTRAAFGLFSVSQSEPIYVSSNSYKIVGDHYLTLDKTESGYSMRSSSGNNTEVMRQLNERLREWDGKSEFKSGYIRKDHTSQPSYFELQLYPTDDTGLDFVGIAQDVTQAYEREEATRYALKMAERSNEAKSRFLSNMSHDIRTPMNAIVNMTNFAIDSIHDPTRLNTYLKTIRESSDHLLRLINEVLDMSRIESGQMIVESEPFDIMAVMRSQTDMMRSICRSRSQTFITNFDAVQTVAVRGDQLKFSQVIMNLLSNAAKFTPEKGAVRFTAAEIPSLRDDLVDMRFTIEDNGIGISPENLKHIFEPFNRADDKRVSKIEGTGLGLSICHSYIAAMGGSIKCESEEGEGSTFVVDLFFQRADAVPDDEASSESPRDKPFFGKRCLLAEDNATNQVIAVTMLERLGFAIDVASDGQECLRRFCMSPPGTYDVIYMDIQMPVMDGYQAAVAIRDSEHAQAKSVPIIAMTANVFAEDIEKARIAGMDGHLGKPIISLKLIDETFRVINYKRETLALADNAEDV